ANPAAEVVALAVSDKPALKTVFEREVSVADWPFLDSHRLKGRAVVPMAVLAELLGHAALHANPGLSFHGLDDLRVSKGVILREERYRLILSAGKAAKQGDDYLVPVEARGESGVLHAGAVAVLRQRLPSAPEAAPPVTGEAAPALLRRAYE